MPPSQEFAPVDPTRLRAIAEWVGTRVRPVLHVVAEATQEGDPPQQEFETRGYQLEAWAKLDMSREEGRTRALGNLATGLGKTFVAGVDVMRYRERCAAQDPPMYPRILYVSHKHDINEQAARTFATLMPDAEIDFFKTKRKQLPDADVTFATVQGLYSELGRFDPQDFEYIIWDESHHLEAETFKVVRDYFDPLFEHAITATMERMDGKDIQDYFGTSLYQKTLPEGIAEGHLADVNYHIVFDKTIREKLKGGFNPKTLGEIKELFKDKPPIDEIARSIEEEIERLNLLNPKIIAFCESINEADALAVELGGVAYHSGATDRPQILSNFRSGQLRRITTRDMFNEGMDIPDADLLIFLRGTSSSTIFEQQLGRGLRRAPGKTKVHVLDYVANVERIAKVRELSESIQRHASQLGQREITQVGDAGDDGDDARGLHIHTAHGDFDFDSIAVDLLAKFDMLKRPAAPVAAEEYYSINGAYEAFGVGPKLLEKLIGEMGWELPLRKFGPQTVRAISLQQIEQLRSSYPDAFALPVPEGYLSIKGAAGELGVDFYTVKRIVDESGWKLPRHKFKGGVVSVALSPEQVAEIGGHPNVTAKSQSEGVVSIVALAHELSVAASTLKNLANEHGISIREYRFGKGKTRGEGFTSSQAASLREIVISRETEPGLLSTKEAAHELGIHYQTIVRLINELGLTLPKRKAGNGRIYSSVSREQIELIRASDRYRKVVEKVHWRRSARGETNS